MKDVAVKIAIVGIPLLLSLLWFFYWIVKLQKAKKRLRSKKAVDTGSEDSQ